MRIVVGCDHAGVKEKDAVAAFLRQAGHDVNDVGTGDEESVDYPDFAERVARAVASNDADFGVLICGTGIGMAMTANKVPGVRAAVVHSDFTARMARQHNDANVLCMGARVLDGDAVQRLCRVFLDTPFEGGRHARRVDKIKALDRR